MTIAPHSGIIDFGTFTPPTDSQDGIQGEVPAPLIAEVAYVLSATGWVPMSGGGSGTVTSVSGTGTVSGLSLSGTVTTSGSLTLGGTLAVLPSNFASQTANTVLAAPNGSAGTPTFRAIVAADVPTLNQNTTGTASNVTGIVAVANGGTGANIAGTARTNLSAAASGANTDITSIALTTGTISTAPASNNDIVNKAYVDTLAASGIHFHQPVRVEAPINLNATYNNGTAGVGATLTNAGTQVALVIDGVTVSVADRVLIYEQTTQTQNGIYVVTSTGSGSTNWVLTRSSDADTYVINSANGLSEGSTVFVQEGATGAGETYTCNTSGTITFGTTAITFVQIASGQIYSAGTGLTLTGTVFSITNTGVSASTYGSASSVPVIAINAQGQATSVTNTSIAISASQITSGTLPVANGGTGVTTSTGTGSVVLSASPTFTGTLNAATISATKILPNVQSVASASTITPNANTDTQVSVTALAVPATIASPSGTPSDGQSLVIRIEDNGTGRALTWTTGSSGAYRAVGITLPTTTVATKVLYVGCKYNSTDLRWDAIALSQEA